jgi:hypothetical protein
MAGMGAKIRVGGAEIVLQMAPPTVRFRAEFCKQTFHFHGVSVSESAFFSRNMDRLDRDGIFGERQMTLIRWR